MAEMFNANDKTTPGAYGPGKTALLLLDFHGMFVEKAGGPNAQAAFDTAVKLRAWAKSKGIAIVHGLVDVNATPFANCKGFDMFVNVLGAMKASGADEPAPLTEGISDKEPTFTRLPGYVSALKSPGLEDFLQKNGIKSLLICGLATSGCVLRTACSGTDAEYVVTVISDACADPGEGVHEMLMKEVLPNRGFVATAAEFQDGFEKVAGGKA